ncbi:MAG: hypothetical protein QM758_23345 [Armatimonas sp.]
MIRCVPAMRGTLLWTFHLVFRTPESEARALLPEGIEPLTAAGWAFYNVAISEFSAVRADANPLKIGRHGHILAYRLYARAKNSDTVGLYGLQTECDVPALLEKASGLSGTPVLLCQVEVYDDTHGTVQIDVEESDSPLKVILDTRGKPMLSENSPFPGLSEAGVFLRPPAFIINAEGQAVNIGRQVKSWESRLVRLPQQEWSFFDGKTVTFELCFDVPTLEYRWPEGYALAP